MNTEVPNHTVNARKNGTIVSLPKVKIKFASQSFYFLGASVFNSLPLTIRQIDCRALFKKSLDGYFLFI